MSRKPKKHFLFYHHNAKNPTKDMYVEERNGKVIYFPATCQKAIMRKWVAALKVQNDYLNDAVSALIHSAMDYNECLALQQQAEESAVRAAHV